MKVYHVVVVRRVGANEHFIIKDSDGLDIKGIPLKLEAVLREDSHLIERIHVEEIVDQVFLVKDQLKRSQMLKKEGNELLTGN